MVDRKRQLHARHPQGDSFPLIGGAPYSRCNLQPIDFTVLKPQTRVFLKELLTQIFISTQISTPLLSSDPKDHPASKNRGSIEEVFIKATKMQTLALGLIYFIGETFKSDEEGILVKWASQVAIDTLRTGMDVISGL